MSKSIQSQIWDIYVTLSPAEREEVLAFCRALLHDRTKALAMMARVKGEAA
ncbi:MAG: hypothetical protein LBJ11_09040 [Oscillospiraceae bacterium]|jgi:hypothetical protein|nr:hypothetical protein [Oscillospiraceae bacterium]